MAAIPGPGAPASLRARALRLLARREHSRVELQRKLAVHARDEPGASAATQIERTLDELAAHDLLCDRRAADALVRAGAARLGRDGLKHRLRQRGIDPDTADAALAALPGIGELARARALRRRRFGDALPLAPAERARQGRFLAGRGFAAEVVHRAVSDNEA